MEGWLHCTYKGKFCSCGSHHIGCIGIISESCCHVLSDTCIIISSERVGRVNVGVSSDAHISTLLDRIADKFTCNFILELNIKVSHCCPHVKDVIFHVKRLLIVIKQ